MTTPPVRNERAPCGARAGRFAPSPTGPLHLGSLRTAVLGWLAARTASSSFALRIEDLDERVSRRDVEEGQRRDLDDLGVTFDGPVVRQSERRDRYADAIARLEATGLTYPCYCSRREIREAASAPHDASPHEPLPRTTAREGNAAGTAPVLALEAPYPGTCRSLSARQRAEREAAGRTPALRLRAEGARRGFVDRVWGWFEGPVDDVVIRRNDGTPAYQLAVVVDDVAQGIGEVVRGDDLLASTPRQLFVAEALGWAPPSYAHVPLVLGPSGERLAKRDGAVGLAEHRARGRTHADVLGALVASVGWWPAGEPLEPDRLGELAAGVDLATVPRAPWSPGPDLLGA
jgi:glutamyl-tRNA synthetase